MTRLKVHHMAEGGTPQAVIAAKCSISLRSVERVLTEPEPKREEVIANARTSGRRRGRPTILGDALVERIRVLVGEESDIAATEVLRRARGWGYRGSRSTMAALVKELRPTPKREPVVRFERLAPDRRSRYQAPDPDPRSSRSRSPDPDASSTSSRWHNLPERGSCVRVRPPLTPAG